MKHCGKCGETKPIEQFHRWKRDGYQPWCKVCRKTYDAVYNRRTRDRRRARRPERKREFRQWYEDLKMSRPCADRGDYFHWASTQWDHLPGFEKRADVGVLAGRMSKRLVLEEIEKCELVCANCHALRTVVRRDGA